MPTRESIETNKLFRESIIQIAKDGGSKPHWKSKEYNRYRDQLRKTKFRNELMNLRPDWFIDFRLAGADEKNKKILNIAINGGAKPKLPDILARALSTQLRSDRPESIEFINKLKELRPEWFGRKSTSERRKYTILDRARSGEPKPHYKSSDWAFIKSRGWVNSRKKSYDPQFVEKLEAIRPDWFASSRQELTENRRQHLRNQAKIGAPRPHNSSREWTFIKERIRYKKDEDFIQELKTLAPHWFELKRIEKEKRNDHKKRNRPSHE